MSNQSTTKGAKPSKFTWRQFDALPLHCKELLWYSSQELHAKEWPIQAQEDMAAKIKEIERKSCLAVYGADHPQSGVLSIYSLQDFVD